MNRPMPESLTRDEQIVEVDRLIAENGPDLQLWLADQRLKLEDADPRPHWGSITSNLRSRNLIGKAERWIRDEKKALTTVWKVTGRSRVAAELCRRFVAARMSEERGAPRVSAVVGDGAELDVLPAFTRWVIQHRDFVQLDEATDEEKAIRQAEIVKYELEFPAPSQAARNMLRHCQKNPAYAQKVFDEAKTYITESRKKKKEDVGELDKKEQARVLDMKAELAKMKGGAA